MGHTGNAIAKCLLFTEYPKASEEGIDARNEERIHRLRIPDKACYEENTVDSLNGALSTSLWAQTLPYQNPDLSSEARAKDLLTRLTLSEKASLMCDESDAIPRLGIKKFNWWSEALHGLANNDSVTVFPEPIGMAASFDDALVYRVFRAVSDETRAKYNEAKRRGQENRRFLEPVGVDPQREYIPRSPLGKRPGNLRGRSLPDVANGRFCRERTAGSNRCEISRTPGLWQALCRALWSRMEPPYHQP